MAGFSGGMEQVRLWAEWEWPVEKITECPQCLPLAGSAAGADGRKRTGVVEPREKIGFS